MKPSRLLVVNCTISESITEVIDAAARAAAGPSTEVVTLAPTWGVVSAEGYLDGHLASVPIMDVVRRYEQPYDAMVLYVDVPVVDPVAAGVALALVRVGLRTSKACTSAAPREKLRPGWDTGLERVLAGKQAP
jgi:Asp/Glu/hydantoin racemase